MPTVVPAYGRQVPPDLRPLAVTAGTPGSKVWKQVVLVFGNQDWILRRLDPEGGNVC
jgi:hypothetical protein